MLGVVTGLTAEARLARPLGLAVAGGGTAAGARRAAERLAVRGASTLISFGLAGGLDPALRPGKVLIPARVVTRSGVFQADPALVVALRGPTVPTMLDTGSIVSTAADKARLRQASDAAAIDMESGEVAAVAAERGLNFAVLRAVCDPADSDLPPAALAALDAIGRIAFGRVVASVLRHPLQIPALLTLARDARLARDALRQHVATLKDLSADPRF